MDFKPRAVRPSTSQTSSATPSPVVSAPRHSPSAPSEGLQIKSKKRSLFNKKNSLTLLIAAATLLIAGFLFALARYSTAPVHVSSLELRHALNSRVGDDVPAKDSFTVGEPIVAVFTFKNAQVGVTVSTELKRGDRVARTITLPDLRSDEKEKSGGTRYVALANGSATPLEAGTYRFIIKSDNRTIATRQFIVRDTTTNRT